MTFIWLGLAAAGVFALINIRINLGRIAHALEVLAKIAPEQRQ